MNSLKCFSYLSFRFFKDFLKTKRMTIQLFFPGQFLYQANAQAVLILHIHAPTGIVTFRMNVVLSWECVSNAGSLPLEYKNLLNLHEYYISNSVHSSVTHLKICSVHLHANFTLRNTLCEETSGALLQIPVAGDRIQGVTVQ